LDAAELLLPPAFALDDVVVLAPLLLQAASAPARPSATAPVARRVARDRGARGMSCYSLSDESVDREFGGAPRPGFAV
jgi:hypothetical protein